MNGKVVPVKMPGYDLRKADAFVTGGVAAAPDQAPVKTKRLTIDVPLDLHTRIKIACAKRGLNMADEARRLLEQEFPAD